MESVVAAAEAPAHLVGRAIVRAATSEPASNGQVLGDSRGGGSGGSGSGGLVAAGGASLFYPSGWKGMSLNQRKRRRRARALRQPKGD